MVGYPYTVSKGKLGRFNFSLATKHGRLYGSVAVRAGKDQSPSDVQRIVRDKIKALAGELLEASNAETL